MYNVLIFHAAIETFHKTFWNMLLLCIYISFKGTVYPSNFEDKDTLHKLHANYVLVPADKAANNVIVVCKKYYIDTLVKELGINNINSNNPTYIQ